MSETATDNLAAVLGDSGRVVKVGDTEITIRPLVVAQITHMLRALNPLLQRLRQGVQGDASSLAWMLADEPDAVLDGLAIALAKLPARLSDKAAMAASFADSTEWLSGLTPDTLTELLVAVVEVNADFFTRQVLPMLSSKMAVTGLPSSTD